jgi:transcriptional regulator with XRE-family HTH domain
MENTVKMTTSEPKAIGRNLDVARKAAGLTQAALAKATQIQRVQIVRIEAGKTIPRLSEAVRLAKALKAPLEYFVSGRFSPGVELRDIAIELYRLGIRDLEVSDPRVPGTFRHKEEILVLAVAGDRPEPRVIESIPYLLLRRHFLPAFTAAFADLYDERTRTRLAWLSEIALALNELSSMPLLPFGSTPDGRRSRPASLGWLIKEGKKPYESPKEIRYDGMRTGRRAPEPDSLGHPGDGKFPPIWRRWNITYAGTMDDFLRRSVECHSAFEATRTIMGDEL